MIDELDDGVGARVFPCGDLPGAYHVIGADGGWLPGHRDVTGRILSQDRLALLERRLELDNEALRMIARGATGAEFEKFREQTGWTTWSERHVERPSSLSEIPLTTPAVQDVSKVLPVSTPTSTVADVAPISDSNEPSARPGRKRATGDCKWGHHASRRRRSPSGRTFCLDCDAQRKKAKAAGLTLAAWMALADTGWRRAD